MWHWTFLAFLAFEAAIALRHPDQVTCEPMKIDICKKDNFWNMTGFPNFAGHKIQADAGEQLKTWLPLVETNCAPELQLFLCVIHAPMCLDMPPNMLPNLQGNPQKLIGPCFLYLCYWTLNHSSI